MSDAVYVGNNVAELAKNYTFSAISRVTIQIDNDTTVTAGNDTGRELVISCPWGTQTMANNILNSVKNYKYQPFEATQALLDPAAEVGDAITIGGIYSVIVDTNINYDGTCMTTITAPEDEEVDSEYPYLPKIERQVSSAQNAANNAQNTANNAQNTANNAQNTADSALDAAQGAADDAEAAQRVITGWQYPGSSVKIDGANLKAGTVQASKLLGGVVGLLNANETQVGTMSITGSSSSNVAIELSSIGALRLVASSGNIYMSNGSGRSFQLGTNVSVGGTFIPNANDRYTLGSSGFKWTDVYATNGTIQTSDRNAKTDINYDMSAYNAFYDRLAPATSKFIDGHRKHMCFIAQDVEQALNDSNISTEDFAGLIKTPDDTYALRYTEFVALNTYQIQQLKKEVAELKAEISKLKNGGE